MNNLIYITPIALVCIIILWFVSRKADIVRMRKNPLMIGFSIFYSDTRGKNQPTHCGRLLRSHKHQLCGKPDIVYRRNQRLIVAELKSGKVGLSPRPKKGDLLQLAAYFIIVEEEFSMTVTHGLLVYSDGVFRVKNTPKLRRQVLGTVRDMRGLLKTKKEPPKRGSNCYHCLYVNDC